MHRFAARIGSAFAILVLLATTVVRADSVSYAFERSSITFTHIARNPSGTAVGIDDPALRSLLKSLGATLTWRPGDHIVLITTSAPEVIGFSVGNAQYSVGPITAQGRFAPYLNGSEVYLPFDDVMRALGVSAQDGVLERLLTSLDVQGYGVQAVLIAHGGGVLRPRVVTDTPDRVVYEFDGVGTTLAPQRAVNAGGIRTVEITSSGSARDPKTLVTIELLPGTRHDAPQSGSGEFEVAFGANGSAPPLVEPLHDAVAAAAPANAAPATTAPPPPDTTNAATPSQSPSEQATAGATVNAVTVQATGDGGQAVTIAVTGDATYEWHRLRAPDNRFWIDIKNAQLAGGPQDQAETNPLVALRVRQIDPQTVRIALSLADDNALDVSPATTGISVNVGTGMLADTAPRGGTGSIGAVVSASEPQTLVTPVPADEYGATGDQSGWKFGPQTYVPTNPKLIVLDPGHGGGDRGSMHGDLQESILNLDLAKRVQAILVARGWQVKMTRTIDHDVDPTPRSTQEAIGIGHDNVDAYALQARDDIANEAGARLFVSIHCNAYLNSGPNGATVYYSKPIDVQLAQIMDRDIAMSGLGVKDDGIVKSHLYVTSHANMPSVLVETAFLSNPSDYAKLASSDWRQQMAQAIADGIDKYAQQNPVAGSAQ